MISASENMSQFLSCYSCSIRDQIDEEEEEESQVLSAKLELKALMSF